MKVSDCNKIRAAVFMEAVKNTEVTDALSHSDRCYIYDVIDGKQQHGILVLAARTQLNDNALSNAGFDAATVHVTLSMTLDRKTKCATFGGGL